MVTCSASRRWWGSHGGVSRRGEAGPIRSSWGRTLLLINVEQETSLRAPDPMRRRHRRLAYRGQPDIRLNIDILSSRATNKDRAVARLLSQIIQYFQTPGFDHQNSPSLDEQIDKLVLELALTPPFQEQNNIWSALRTTYQPSVLYRVRMIVFAGRVAVHDRRFQEARLMLRPRVAPILDLCVTHPYYDDGRSNDSPSNRRPLPCRGWKGSGCSGSQRGDQLSVFAGLDRRPSLVSLRRRGVRFRPAPARADFLSFTDLDGFDALPAPLFTDGGELGWRARPPAIPRGCG